MHPIAAVGVAAAMWVALIATSYAQENVPATPAPKPKPGPSMPFVRLTDNGELHMAYVDEKDGVKTVRYRRTFGDAPLESAVSAPGDKFSHFAESPPVVEVMRDGTVHVLYTVRVKAEPGGDAYPIELRLATSADGGRTWKPYQVMGDVAVRVYRACASMREDAQGNLVLSWLEGHPGLAAIGVKSAVIHEGKIDAAWVNEKVCECCGTELSLANDGTMWLAYRGVDSMNVRDMFLARMTPGALRFGPSTQISSDRWVVAGCPEMGPRIAWSGKETAWVAWFVGEPRGIYAARTTGAAPHFEPRELVQGVDDRAPKMAQPAIGTLPDGRVLVAYRCNRDGALSFEGRLREAAGWGEPIALGGPGEYLRIASNGKKAYLVYTAIGDTSKSIVVRDLAELIPSAK
jgi:hypothetical protein